MPSTPTCPDESELLKIALGEEIDAAVREHVDGCAQCHSRVEQFRAEVASLVGISPGATGSCSTERDPASSEEANRSDEGSTESWKSSDGVHEEDTEPVGPDDVAGARERAEGTGQVPGAIGRYMVVGRIDGGGEADVYRVVHIKLGNDLVLKHARRRATTEDHTRLVEEGRRLVRLKHTNLVRIYDLDFHEDRPFLVMEYVDGRNLEDFARHEPVSPRRAAALVAKLAGVMSVAHQHGITHCDIKPKNVVMDKLGEPRLIDFGMARLQHAWSDIRQTTWGGTLAYMAPEQARLEIDRIGPRSDIFALGGVLYFLLTGLTPFKGETSDEIWVRAKRCDFEPGALRAAKVPRGLERICLKAMAAEPSDRYATAEALQKALERYIAGPKRLAALAVFVSILAVAAGVWSITHADGTQTPRTSPIPLAGDVNVWIWNPNDPARRRLTLNDPEAMPLRAGDQVRVEARINRPAHLYLVWLDAEGVPQPVYPWKPGDWSEKIVGDIPVTRISLPASEGKGWEMKKGAAGMETVILLAREKPLDLDLKSELAGLPRPAFQDARSLVWFDNWALVQPGAPGQSEVKSRDRGPSFFEADIKDPVLQTQELLKERLKSHFSMMRAVSFANRGG
jgi:serine/threonine protein kinase